jgi:hypothetical protein
VLFNLLEESAMIIAIWIVALLGLALWSLLAWGLNAALNIDPSRLQDLKPLIERIPYGDFLGEWLPNWQAMLAALVDLSQTLLSWVGSAAPWLVAALWGLGAVVILGLAGLGSLAVVLIRKGVKISQEQQGLGSATR